MADRTVRVRLTADVKGYENSVDRASKSTEKLKDDAERFSKRSYDAKLGVDTGSGQRALSQLEKQINRLTDVPHDARVNIDSEEAKQRIDQVQDDLRTLGATTADAKLNVKDGESLAKLNTIESKLLKLARVTADPTVDLDGIASSEAQLAGLQTQLKAFDTSTHSARVKVTGIAKSQKQMSSLAVIGAGIAPAIVPAAAASTAAIVGLASASTAAVGGASALFLAFSGVGDALTALNKYQLDPTEASMDKMNETMNQLSGTGQDFVKFLDSMGPRLDEIQALAQEGLFPGVEDGIRRLNVLWPDLVTLVDNASSAMGNLASEAGATLGSPFWRQWFDWLATEAGPKLDEFGRTVGNLATGFAGMMQAFDPMADDLTQGLLRMSREFSEWGRTLSQAQGFEDFTSYVREVTPQVLETLGAIGGAIGDIAVAAAPIGTVVLHGLELLADILGAIASIPGLGSTLVGVASGIAAINAAMRIVNVAKASDLAVALGSIKKNGKGTGTALRGVGSILGGPWTLAVGGATVALGLLLEKHKEYKEGVKDLKESLDGESGAMTENTNKIVANKLAQNGALEIAKKYGINLSDVRAAAAGSSEASDRLRASTEDQKVTMRTAGGVAHKVYNPELRRMFGNIGEVNAQLKESKNEWGSNREEQGLVNESLKQTRGEMEQTKNKVDRFGYEISDTTAEMVDQKVKSQDLDGAIKALGQEVENATLKDLDYRDGLTKLSETLKENGATTDRSTQKGRDNIRMVIDAANNAEELLVAQNREGAGTEELTRKNEQYRQQLMDTLIQMGFSQDEAQKLTDKYYNVPNDVITAVTTPGMAEAQRNTDILKGKFSKLAGRYEAQIEVFGGVMTRDGLDVGRGTIPRASGGAVHGPGTERSDSIGAKLSNNEHVWTAREVKGAGGHRQVAMLRRQAASGDMPGYAQGGAVRPNLVGNVNWQAGGLSSGIDNALAAAKRARESYANVGGGVQQWADEVRRALAIMGQPASLVGTTLRRMNQESGGNPGIVNKWDSNWRRGTPSVGLMQVIGPTYRSNVPSGYDRGPYKYGASINPMSNILASMNYAIGRYGSLSAAYNKSGGYDSGGYLPTGHSLVYNGTGKPEPVLTSEQFDALANRGDGGPIEVKLEATTPVYLDGKQITRAVNEQNKVIERRK